MWTTPRQTLPARPPIEESCSLAEITPPTGYEPKLLDDFHYSETTEIVCCRRRRSRHRSSFLTTVSGSRQPSRLFNTVTLRVNVTCEYLLPESVTHEPLFPETVTRKPLCCPGDAVTAWCRGEESAKPARQRLCLRSRRQALVSLWFAPPRRGRDML